MQSARAIAMFTFLCVTLSIPGLPGNAAASEDKADAKKEAPKLDQAALEKKFQEDLTDAVFSGQFTTLGQKEEKPARPEKYTITKVIKLQGDLWVLHARIQYGDHDVTVPVPLRIQWAGDTPVITLTDVAVPGLGTFTSRVLIYNDRYAGTWQHGDVGGHLFGTIEKAKKEEK